MNKWFYENALRCDYSIIAGGDEVGRGCLAGPVVAAIVCLDPNKTNLAINDSKKLSENLRNQLSFWTQQHAFDYGIGLASPKEIDRYNIFQATKIAFFRAYQKVSLKIDFLLLDALFISKIPVRQKALIKGDQKSFSIAAASILAKVYRDNLMKDYHKKYPFYGFDQHKGYAVPLHLKKIEHKGPCLLHRKSFAPIKKSLLT